MRNQKVMSSWYKKPIYTEISFSKLSDDVLVKTQEEKEASLNIGEASDLLIMSKSVQEYISLLAKGCAKDILREMCEIVRNNHLENIELQLKVFSSWASLVLPNDPMRDFGGFYDFSEFIVSGWHSSFRDEIARVITMMLGIVPTRVSQEQWNIIITT